MIVIRNLRSWCRSCLLIFLRVLALLLLLQFHEFLLEQLQPLTDEALVDLLAAVLLGLGCQLVNLFSDIMNVLMGGCAGSDKQKP